MKKVTKIYGAYGSNMNLSQMKKRCPNARVIGVGKIHDYRLTFRGRSHGVANIEKMQGQTVPIVLWEIREACEKALDIYEGYPRLYIKEEVEVASEEGRVTAMVYVMTKGYEKLPASPTSYYLDIIWQGYVDNKIAIESLKEAVAENTMEISNIEG